MPVITPRRFLLAMAAAVLPLTGAGAVDLVALTDRHEIVRFTDATPGNTVRMEIIGAGSTVIGIDVRPADGQLYLLTVEGAILTIDPVTAKSTFKSVLSVPLAAASGYLVDFNPVADRFRVIGAGRQNLRVNVDTGATIVDGPIKFEGGKAGRIVAGAYSNSVKGAQATRLYAIDETSGAYLTIDPPNDGVVKPLGATGLASPPIQGMDILTTGTTNAGFAVAGGALYRIDPATGALTPLSYIGDGSLKILDIAVLPPR